MRPVRRVTGTVAHLDRPDVDTDQIVPKQFLRSTERSGLGKALFHDWMQDPDFELRRPEYTGACILVAGPAFGCGSSREHAVWALQDYGFEAVIAPSFGDIFAANCAKCGLLAITLPADRVAALRSAATLTIDLERQAIVSGARTIRFAFDPFTRHLLLNGLDEIALTLEHDATIAAFEAAHPAMFSTLKV